MSKYVKQGDARDGKFFYIFIPLNIIFKILISNTQRKTNYVPSPQVKNKENKRLNKTTQDPQQIRKDVLNENI